MRINCPICGERDLREFSYTGAAVLADRPAPDAGEEVWDAYLHLRDNPAGPHRELWHHALGCRAWLVAERNITTHEFCAVTLARAEEA